MWLVTYEITIPVKETWDIFPPIIESKICKTRDIDDCMRNELLEYLYERCEDYMEAIRKLLKTFGVDEDLINLTINEWVRDIAIWAKFEEIDPKE